MAGRGLGALAGLWGGAWVQALFGLCVVFEGGPGVWAARVVPGVFRSGAGWLAA